MKCVAFCFLLLVGDQSLCVAEVTKLPKEDRKVLEDSSGVREIHATAELPPAVTALCADENGRLADPGQNWEPTDVVGPNSSLPRKRLVWAAINGDYYVVHYERGGIAHSFHILVVTAAKNGGKPKIVWRAMGNRLKNYSEFVSTLHTGKLDDRLDYAH